jgi:hypothetical protein
MVLLPLGTACAEEPEDDANAAMQDLSVAPEGGAAPAKRSGRIELRRQNSERGTPEESTRTTLRVDSYLMGPVSRLRFDLQFPDEKTDFGGDPFQPRLGDTKVRADFRPFQAGHTRLSTDIELTFPTAVAPEFGAGKYQFSAALHSIPGAPDLVLDSGRHQLRFGWNIRQTISIAGDADRQGINNTKPEIELRDTIGSECRLKLTFKPTIDWIQDGKTGAVLELEGEWNPNRDWRFSLMGGANLWGQGLSGIYQRRVQLVGGRAF